MPTPRKGETRAAYIRRAIKMIKAEEPEKDMDAVLGKAYGMWSSHKGGKARVKRARGR